MGHDIIEINGKKYSAKTGELIEGEKPPKNVRVNIDGIIKAPTPKPIAPKSAEHKPPAAANHVKRHPAKFQKRPTQKAHTLLRQGLSKPLSTSKQEEPSLDQFVGKVEEGRAQRAKSIEKSHLVSRFGPHPHKSSPSFVKRSAHLPVVAPIQESVNDDAATNKDIFEKAIENAVSHEAHRVKTSSKNTKRLGLSKKAFNRSAVALATLLIVAFFAYQNIPNINYRLAANRAGVNSSYPGFVPPGFAYKSIEATPGKLVLNFKSNTDERSFSLYQTNSNWSSEVLLNNFVTLNRDSYQSYQHLGRTIYIYDENNATWVDGGIWYRIEGDSKLTTNQLFDIANSL